MAHSAPSANGGFSASYARLVFEHVRTHGLATEGVLEALGLREADLSSSTLRVPARRLTQALGLASALCQDPHIGLTIGQSVRPAHMGSLGYALTSCADLVDGLAQFERLQSLICTEVHVHHRVVGDQIESHHEVIGDVPRDYLFWSFVIVSRMAFARWVAGRYLVPHQVELPCPAPADPRPLSTYLGAPLRFDAPVACERAPADWLMLPNPNADPHVHTVMSAMTHQQWQQTSQEGDQLVGQLRQHIRHSLQQGQVPTLEALTERVDTTLGVSARQLQRRLADQGLNFKDLVESVRRDQVLHELRHTGLPLSAVAERAAYAEPSSMHRAVRRWTGLTPAGVRAQGVAPGEPTEGIPLGKSGLQKA
ncbi:MAG TPA: AraC family transcriptional regulator [Aquabacterium sp.]|nr:AraC family transcriptional regulator [Aquabacterium sp.]HRH29329.1 AraC family transcriptional regulator [Aquabacterium sp.]